MAPGNAWHFPGNAEFPMNVGMRSPVFPTDLTTPVTIFSGNQFAGGPGAADQWSDGSAVVYKAAAATDWTVVPMTFFRTIDNNKYFSAAIDVQRFATGTRVQYYLVIAYNPAERERTFLKVADGDTTGMLSQAATREDLARNAPFTFTLETPTERGKWSPSFQLPNVGTHAHLLRNGKVLMWGRRDTADQSMNTTPPTPLVPGGAFAPPASCTPWLLTFPERQAGQEV